MDTAVQRMLGRILRAGPALSHADCEVGLRDWSAQHRRCTSLGKRTWARTTVDLKTGLLAAAFSGVAVAASSSKCPAVECAGAPPAQPKRARVARRLVVARESEFPEGELRQVTVPPTANGCSDGVILLARLDGQFFATGASCSHYSAPLAQGVVAKDKYHVVCPWHDAAFDLRTGLPVRGPALMAIPTYAVSVENGEVIVDLPKNMEEFTEPQVVERDANDKRVFAIVGGGAAGAVAADTLRQEGYAGRIILLSAEKHLPYDRPVLSKNFAKAEDVESLALRSSAHFEALGIEVRLGAEVTSLDAGLKEITLRSGEQIRYDKALVATGARPRPLPVPGGNLPELTCLRTPEDARRIAANCGASSTVVVIGSSFIGMEVAATLRRRGCKVVVLGMEAVPFERVLGRRVGQQMKDFFESKGIEFIGEASVVEVKQATGGLRIALKSGKTLDCAAAVVGIGVIPNGEFVTGVEKARDGSLKTDASLKTSAEGLYAAGDMATYTTPSGEAMRVEHWDVATSQGRVAARNMAGKEVIYEQTPFFWTSIFGKNLRYVGYCLRYDELLVDGHLSKLAFAAYYCQDGKVKAVATMGCDPAAVAAAELIRQDRMPLAKDLKSGKASTAGLVDILHNGK